MKKLKLRMDDLRVDSFATSLENGGRGTVLGRDWSDQWTCAYSCGCPATGPTCGDQPTCYNSCDNYTCDYTGCVACEQNTMSCGCPGFSEIYTCEVGC